MIRFRSIRVRLTIWYSAMLFVGIILLGSAMWVGIDYGIRAAVQQRLADRLDGIVQPVATESGQIRNRLRIMVRNPAAAVQIMPEAAEEIAGLSTEAEREQFVTAAVRRMAEGRMQRIAELMPPGDFLEVRDSDGATVAVRQDAESFPWPEITGEDPFETADYEDQPYLAHARVFEVQGKSYQFYTATSVASLRAIVREVGAFLYWAALFFLLLSTLGGWMIATRALRPVDEITRTAQSISIEDLSHRLEVPKTGDELERLAGTWNGMLERLDEAVERLTQFTADASHELRTPTAVIRTTAELALRRERSPEDYRESLRKIHNESGRMSQLVEDLLTLARADGHLDSLPMMPVNLSSIALDVCEDYRILGEAKHVTVDWNLPNQAETIRGSEPALRRLLILLLDNAIKYTNAGGAVTVTLRNSGGSATLEVSDTGIGIHERDLPHIFDRFYRADPSRSRSTGSFGLGLSVAKWIAVRHNARIEVESTEGSGSLFRVRFPGAARIEISSTELKNKI